jgi:nitrate/nitrite transporter NarK
MATDRFGARSVALAGMIALSVALLLLAAVPHVPWVFYAILIALGLIGTITNNVVYCKGVATWFTRNLGTAVALVLSGVSIVGALLQPALARVVTSQGWRAGYVCLAATTLIVGLPVVMKWFRERPEYIRARTTSAETVPGVAVKQALRDSRFWLLIAAFGGAAMPIGGFVNQLQPLLISKGYPAVAAAGLAAVFLLTTALGRLAAGFLFDHRSPPRVACSFLALAGIGAAALGFMDFTGLPWLGVAASVALIGLAQGAEGDFIALFTLRIFGLRYFSTLFATIATASGISFALGGLLFAALFDRRGNYDAAVLLGALVLLSTALLAYTIKVPPLPRAS